MNRRLIFVCVIALTLLGGVALLNFVTLQQPVTRTLADDTRNEGIDVLVHYQWFVNPNILIFDLRGISDSNTPLDVTRSLLQAAEALEEKSFEYVHLTHRGTGKYMLEGEFFKKLGAEYGVQNPVYTLRTLPENVLELDGSQAFGNWTGGLLGVTSRQMEDLDEFHRNWFLSDLL